MNAQTKNLLIKQLGRITILGLSFGLTFAACGKKKTALEYALENPEKTSYEVQCLSKTPVGPSGQPLKPGEAVPMPPNLPTVQVPIKASSCDMLGGDIPHFANRTQNGLMAIADCNNKVVRFQTRDYQVVESAGIGPTGNIDLRVMYITRMLGDVTTAGSENPNENCWTRLLGHITGTVECPAGNPEGARMTLKVDWTFDTTPPEIMEPASAGHADLRNGKHCKVVPGTCVFTNEWSMGCGG